MCAAFAPDMTCTHDNSNKQGNKVMSNSMKFLLLAGALSFAAASAAHATDGPGGPTDGTSRSGASAAPVCDGTGRTQKTANDGRLSRDWCRVIAGDDTGPG